MCNSFKQHVSQFLIYREKFHDSRPPGSKNDFGWYKNLEKQWSEWTKDGRAETNEIPTKSILDKIYASKKARQIENIFSTPTEATAPSKCYIYPLLYLYLSYIMLRILSGCTETGNDFLLNHQLHLRTRASYNVVTMSYNIATS